MPGCVYRSHVDTFAWRFEYRRSLDANSSFLLTSLLEDDGLISITSDKSHAHVAELTVQTVKQQHKTGEVVPVLN